MPWQYSQTTGQLSRDGVDTWFAYSGHGKGLNNPDYQHIHDLGPIPQGEWTIGPPYDSGTTGPYTLTLTPRPGVNTFGRTGFKIHGDNRHSDNSASHGCVIASRKIRELIHESNDNDLTVVSGQEP